MNTFVDVFWDISDVITISNREAWSSLKGNTKEEAKRKYIETLDGLKQDWREQSTTDTTTDVTPQPQRSEGLGPIFSRPSEPKE